MPENNGVETDESGGTGVSRSLWARFLRGLSAVDDVIASVESKVIVWSLFLMLLFYFLHVVLRNISSSLGEEWLSKLPMHLVVVITYVGTSVAARRGRHIGIDIAPRILPPKALAVARIGVEFVAMGLSLVLAYAAWLCFEKLGLDGNNVKDTIDITFGEVTLTDESTVELFFMKIWSWIFFVIPAAGFLGTSYHFFVRGMRRLDGQEPDADYTEEDGMDAVAVDAVVGDGMNEEVAP